MTNKHKQLLDEALNGFKVIEENEDIESGHIMADGILCRLLCQLGFNEVVDEFNKLKKWYA